MKVSSVTPLEFFAVWDFCQTHLSPTQCQHIVQDALSIYARYAPQILALEQPPPPGDRDHFAIAQKIKFRCPFLGPQGACQVYPVRELLARLFGCSFNDVSGKAHSVYGCHLIAAHLRGKTVTLLPARATARRLQDLPLTDKRQVYPYYLHALYGSGPVTAEP